MNPSGIRIALIVLAVALIGGAAYSAKRILSNPEAAANNSGPTLPPYVELYSEREPLKKLPKIRPAGTFTVELTRMPKGKGGPISISDEGSAVLCVDNEKHIFELWKDGKSTPIPALPSTVKPLLSAKGKVNPWLVSTLDAYPTDENKIQPVFRGAEYFMMPWEDDGSVIFSRSIIDMKDHRSYYVLDREQHHIEVIPKTDKVPYDSTKDKVTSKDRFFRSKNFLILMEVGDTGKAWVREKHGGGKENIDRLLSFDTKKPAPQSPTQIDMPKGYDQVRRVCETKGVIVGTFGPVALATPCRTFIRTGSTWKELPIPDGFECSFVDKVLDNGLIVGYVMGDDPRKLQCVVWKDDKICILNDLPEWPKGGQVSIIDLVGRDGTMAVQNATDLATRTNDYYMFKIGNVK